MFSSKRVSISNALYLSLAVLGAIFALSNDLLPGLGLSTSIISQSFGTKNFSISHYFTSNNVDHAYQVQIFSRDPLIIYIRNFLSTEEIDHLLRESEGKYEPSKVYGGSNESPIDLNTRVSESAFLPRSDPIAKRINRRARNFQGFLNNSTVIEPLLVQRYQTDGFYNYHFDWDEQRTHGNRISTFMVYLVDECVGGGTNFPFLEQPKDERWCDVIECDEEGRDGYQGVIFKPIKGAAVFWENFHTNGTGHLGVYHAGLPVKEGVKVGLNIWSWDSSWVKPGVEV